MTYDSAAFQAQAVLYRENNGDPVFYFVRKGTHYLHKGVGFDADAPVSIYAKGSKGAVTSKGTKLTLRGTGVSSLTFTPAVTVLNANSDSIEVELPEGVFYFE